MKIKDYKCPECKSNEFFFLCADPHVGLYCKVCGRFLKWANKNEKNLIKIDIVKEGKDNNGKKT